MEGNQLKEKINVAVEKRDFDQLSKLWWDIPVTLEFPRLKPGLEMILHPEGLDGADLYDYYDGFARFTFLRGDEHLSSSDLAKAICSLWMEAYKQEKPDPVVRARELESWLGHEIHIRRETDFRYRKGAYENSILKGLFDSAFEIEDPYKQANALISVQCSRIDPESKKVAGDALFKAIQKYPDTEEGTRGRFYDLGHVFHNEYLTNDKRSSALEEWKKALFVCYPEPKLLLSEVESEVEEVSDDWDVGEMVDFWGEVCSAVYPNPQDRLEYQKDFYHAACCNIHRPEEVRKSAQIRLLLEKEKTAEDVISSLKKGALKNDQPPRQRKEPEQLDNAPSDEKSSGALGANGGLPAPLPPWLKSWLEDSEGPGAEGAKLPNDR